MKVLIYEVEPGACAVIIPAKPTGLYPTPEAAAQAAWETRWHDTPTPKESPDA